MIRLSLDERILVKTKGDRELRGKLHVRRALRRHRSCGGCGGATALNAVYADAPPYLASHGRLLTSTLTWCSATSKRCTRSISRTPRAVRRRCECVLSCLAGARALLVRGAATGRACSSLLLCRALKVMNGPLTLSLCHSYPASPPNCRRRSESFPCSFFAATPSFSSHRHCAPHSGALCCSRFSSTTLTLC